MANRKSLFEELNSLATSREKERLVEQKGEHLISGAINLIEYINENFDEETSTDLVKRLVNSIRTQDPRKFKRGCGMLKK
jgi:poly(3-hydroxyalkanoate) synthetase